MISSSLYNIVFKLKTFLFCINLYIYGCTSRASFVDSIIAKFSMVGATSLQNRSPVAKLVENQARHKAIVLSSFCHKILSVRINSHSKMESKLPCWKMLVKHRLQFAIILLGFNEFKGFRANCWPFIKSKQVSRFNPRLFCFRRWRCIIEGVSKSNNLPLMLLTISPILLNG